MWDGPWHRALHQAYVDISVGDWDLQESEEENFINNFQERWGSFDRKGYVQVLTQALQEGNQKDRVFAIFALGYPPAPHVRTLLAPFLHFSERRERWASAIALGRLKDEQAFSILQGLLLEEIDYPFPYEGTFVEKVVSDAAEEAGKIFGDRSKWEELINPAILAMYERQESEEDDYAWYMYRRYTIVRLFGKWGDRRVVPTCYQALRTCEELGQRRKCGDIPFSVADAWKFYQSLLKEIIEQLES